MSKTMTAAKLNRDPVMRHDLKGCPFCGASPQIQYWHGGGPNKRLISCTNLDCHVSPCVTGEDEKTAIWKWEQRV